MTWNVIPCVFQMGILVYVLKKGSLNPNIPQNYRPITRSSSHAKIIEMLLLPDDNVADNQFGFR